MQQVLKNDGTVPLKHVSELHLFQNGIPCQSLTCYRVIDVSEWYTTHTSVHSQVEFMSEVYFNQVMACVIDTFEYEYKQIGLEII